MNKRKTYNMDYELYLRIERIAVDVTAKTGRIVKWTDVLKFTIEQYLIDSRNDLIQQKTVKK